MSHLVSIGASQQKFFSPVESDETGRIRQTVAILRDAFGRRAPLSSISPSRDSSATRGRTERTVAPTAAAASSAVRPSARALNAPSTRARRIGARGAIASAACALVSPPLLPGEYGYPR